MELEASQQQQLQQADTEQQRERAKHEDEFQLLRNSLLVHEDAKAVLEHQLAASREEASKAIASANQLAIRASTDKCKQIRYRTRRGKLLCHTFNIWNWP